MLGITGTSRIAVGSSIAVGGSVAFVEPILGGVGAESADDGKIDTLGKAGGAHICKGGFSFGGEAVAVISGEGIGFIHDKNAVDVSDAVASFDNVAFVGARKVVFYRGRSSDFRLGFGRVNSFGLSFCRVGVDSLGRLVKRCVVAGRWRIVLSA